MCGAPSAEITTLDEPRKHYLCTGPESHEWRDGDQLERQEPAEEGIGLLAEGVADKVISKLNPIQAVKNLFSRR